jgi:hypothetical protein
MTNFSSPVIPVLGAEVCVNVVAMTVESPLFVIVRDRFCAAIVRAAEPSRR